MPTAHQLVCKRGNRKQSTYKGDWLNIPKCMDHLLCHTAILDFGALHVPETREIDLIRRPIASPLALAPNMTSQFLADADNEWTDKD